MNKNKSRAIWIIIVVIILIVLFMLPRWTDGSRQVVGGWHDVDVDCLPSHQNAALHIHPSLRITVDGVPEVLPANIGIARSCMAEVHTHDVTGTIHIESVAAGKTFTLEQFFAVWGKTIEREGYDMAMTVDGAPNAELGNLQLRDHQQIELTYKTVN